MDVAVRAAVDRLMYEQAVVLHMLRLAGPDVLERQLPGGDRTAGDALRDIVRSLDSAADRLMGQPGRDDGSAGAAVSLEECAAAQREALRRVFRAASALGARRPDDGTLAELRRAAACYTALRPGLLAAVPEAADDPVVRRWQRAPEPPVHPPGSGAFDGGGAPG